MTKTDCEEFIAYARRELAQTNSAQKRAQALKLLIECYYERYADLTDFRTYAAHFLLANGQDFPADAVKTLQSNFGYPRYPKIQPGYSEWDSYGCLSFSAS
jgi:hypothetical protein